MRAEAPSDAQVHHAARPSSMRAEAPSEAQVHHAARWSSPARRAAAMALAVTIMRWRQPRRRARTSTTAAPPAERVRLILLGHAAAAGAPIALAASNSTWRSREVCSGSSGRRQHAASSQANATSLYLPARLYVRLPNMVRHWIG